MYTMFSFNLETRVTEILTTEIVERVYVFHIYTYKTSFPLSFSLFLLSENYDDALLFFVLRFVKDFFHDKGTMIECNFFYLEKQRRNSIDRLTIY